MITKRRRPSQDDGLPRIGIGTESIRLERGSGFAPEPLSVRSVLAILAVRGLGGGLAEAAIGLILVTVCRRLIALDRATAVAGAPQSRDRGPAGSVDWQT